ncbi:helix-turn-helix domain-containing protein [Kitasatospora sp. NPDC090091]|uniref:helix-turn-helix domain-containing protein n=1 Tax=Kitasatospora sp. NPDC090091 TaxID=3364081 RepID=UPI00381D95DE
MGDWTFPRLLRALRVEEGWSLADLAERVHYSRGHVHNIETGKRPPAEDFARAADRALGADGLLLNRWRTDTARPAASPGAARLNALLAATAASSRVLADMADLEIDTIERDVAGLAEAYLACPPGPMLHDAHHLRQDVTARLRTRHHRPTERTRLYRAAGHLSGVLAYAALDLGRADIAGEHARAAWRCADFAGDDELRVWVRGTQSLIARFGSDFDAALDFILDGLQYAHPATGPGRTGGARGGGVGGGLGTGLARLLCGQAQCLANLGDAAGANAALDAAEIAREHAGDDTLGGLFAFSTAKQAYYAGSSLIWLDGGPDAARAAREAETAIRLWQDQGPGERSLDDEHLAHVYLATARLQLDDAEGATAAVAPVLDLPEDLRISWIVKRMDRLAGMLEQPRYAGNTTARDTAEKIRAQAG